MNCSIDMMCGEWKCKLLCDNCIFERCKYYGESESRVLFDYQDTDGCRINYKDSQVQSEIDDVGGVIKVSPRGYGRLIYYLSIIENEAINDEWDAGYITALETIRQRVENDVRLDSIMKDNLIEFIENHKTNNKFCGGAWYAYRVAMKEVLDWLEGES